MPKDHSQRRIELEKAKRALDKAKPAERIQVPIRILCAMQAHVDAGRTDSEITDLINAHMAANALPDSAPPEPWSVQKVAGIIETEHWRDRVLLDPASESQRISADQVQHLRWERAVKAAARWLSLRGMELAGEAADCGNARNFKDAAQGAKLFVDIAKGDGSGKDEPGNAPSVSVFFINGVGVKKAPGEPLRVRELAEARTGQSEEARSDSGLESFD